MFGDSAAMPIGRSGNGPMPDRRNCEVHFAPGGRVLAAQDRAHDRRVLAHLRDRLVDPLAVPELDDGPVRDADAEHHPPARRRRAIVAASWAIVAGVRE